MTTSEYNQEHWTKQIRKYLDQEWSIRPSPFVQIFAKYLAPGSRVLELGTGAGQDGLWLAKQGHTVVLSDATAKLFSQIKDRAAEHKVTNYTLVQMDVTQEFAFETSSFDAVYAQLVLHYFDNETMVGIMTEIKRILKRGGLLACMDNAITDAEYNAETANADDIIRNGPIDKRYFSVESFTPYTAGFEPILFNNQGKTPKDEAAGNSGLIQFIGRLK